MNKTFRNIIILNPYYNIVILLILRNHAVRWHFGELGGGGVCAFYAETVIWCYFIILPRSVINAANDG
jgi:hypothetical protein